MTLHVTGQREDGYHLLDSLVCFPDIGDQLTFSPAAKASLTITGNPDLPCDDQNLVMRAARLFLADHPQEITLIKHFPVSSGIGGGSADAAAVIRAAKSLSTGSLGLTKAQTLGADVTVCIDSQPARMSGIGEIVQPICTWPEPAFILLVNPRVPVSTPKIFNVLTNKTNAPMPADLPQFNTLDTLIEFISCQRNDLQGPAIDQQPIIADVIDMITSTPDCLFARMSGSGATCFGIYRKHEEVLKAAAKIGSNFPKWWVEYGALQSK
jgi:4-diphosphocytidyl-2-C-methyl-D-erythritol kinase